MKMYRATLLLGQAHAPDYVSVYLQEGDRAEINGNVMVALNGHYVPAAGWTPSKADALRRSAEEIEGICDSMRRVMNKQLLAADQAVVDASRRIRMPVPEGGMSRTLD